MVSYKKDLCKDTTTLTNFLTSEISCLSILSLRRRQRLRETRKEDDETVLDPFGIVEQELKPFADFVKEFD